MPLLLVLLSCGIDPPKVPPPHPERADTGSTDTDTADTHTGDTHTVDTGPVDTGPGDTSTSAPTEFCVETDARAKIVGETPWGGGEGFGDSFRANAAGDVNGDGVQDVIAGCAACGEERSGRAYLLSGPFRGTVPVADATATFVQADSTGLGFASASAGDVDGDGFGDLLLTQGPCRPAFDTDNCVLLVPGPLSGTLEPTSVATATFVGEYVLNEDWETASTGNEVGVGDFDGDGVSDVFVSAPVWSGVGAAYVVSGPFSGDVSLTDATFTFENNDQDGVGGLANLGDVDGDGLDDLAIGQADDDECVAVYLGPLSGLASRAEADATFRSPGEPQVAAYRGALAAAGDVNGDGLADALVVSRFLEHSGVHSGGTYVVTGPFAAEVSLADAHAILYDGGGVHQVADGPGDLNGDGSADLVVGAGYLDPPGTTFIVLGPVVGAVSLPDSAYVLHGTGSAAAGALLDHADFDGDGHPDLLVTGPEDTEGGGYAGAAWIFGAI